jgi:hypothetical protein
MISQDKIDNAKTAYKQLFHTFGRVHDFKINGYYYWFGQSQTVGTMFDPMRCKVRLWTVNLDEGIFDEWHDGQFVWSAEKYKEYLKVISELAEKEILE